MAPGESVHPSGADGIDKSMIYEGSMSNGLDLGGGWLFSETLTSSAAGAPCRARVSMEAEGAWPHAYNPKGTTHIGRHPIRPRSLPSSAGICVSGDYDNVLQTCMKYFEVT